LVVNEIFGLACDAGLRLLERRAVTWRKTLGG